jgi:two-component system, NtrC family, response regulator AtoC
VNGARRHLLPGPALAEVGGNRRLAAERLGIGVRTLYEKLKRYGIE